MKNFKLALYILLWSAVLNSCKKEQSVITPVNLSSITIVDATNGSNAIVPDFTDQRVEWFSDAQTIGYNSSAEYAIPSGLSPVSIWETTDTTHTTFKGSFNFAPQKIYSLFFVGTNSTTPATILTIDHVPYYAVGDSVAGVRFANLSPGSNPVSIDLQGMANGSEVSSLPYKSVTDFKTYVDTKVIPASGQYVFEFRDASSGVLLTTYTYSGIARFRSVTIAIDGPPGSQSAFQVNNY